MKLRAALTGQSQNRSSGLGLVCWILGKGYDHHPLLLGIPNIQNCLGGCGDRKCVVELTCPLVPLSHNFSGSGKEAETKHCGKCKELLVSHSKLFPFCAEGSFYD